MKAKIEEKEKAIALRGKGFSIKEIAHHLKVAVSSVSVWVRDVPLTNEQVTALNSNFRGRRNHLLASAANQAKQKRIREYWREQGRQRAIQKDWRHSAACSLYWAEGTKNRNAFTFPNNDPAMIKFLYRWVVEEFGKCPRVSFSYHEDEGNAPKQEAAMFWADILGVPIESVSSFANKDKRPRSGLKKNRHKYGMGILYLGSTQVCQHIYGALEVYSGVILCE